jgi:hypothetical protein
MKRLLGMLLIAVVAGAQTPTRSTIPDLPAAPSLDPAPIAIALAQSSAFTQALATNVTQLGQYQYADEQHLASLDALAAGLQQQINATRPGQNEVLLVIPTSSPVGWSGVPVAVTEFQGNVRTRRMFDFTNVHQVRLCQNTGAALAGGVLNLEQSADQLTWTALASADIGVKGISCSAWAAYAGPQSDAVIRVTGANPLATVGTPSWWYVSMEVR